MALKLVMFRIIRDSESCLCTAPCRGASDGGGSDGGAGSNSAQNFRTYFQNSIDSFSNRCTIWVVGKICKRKFFVRCTGVGGTG